MAHSPRLRLRVSWALVSVGVSAAFFGVQAGPLYGTASALALAGALLIGLPGYLLARAVGLLTHRLVLVQLATAITCGFVLTLLVGGLFRFAGWSITGYLGALHAILLVLALLPARRPIPRPKLPPLGISVTVIGCTAVLIALAALAARFAYAGELSDRGYFASVNHWLLTSSGSEGQLVRIIGMGAETRLRVEGLTVFSAALEYGSGISAFDYQWHLQPPLLIATLPVVVFALVYRITRRQRTAALAVALLTLLTAQTFQYTVYAGMAGFTGRHPLLDLRTLREVGLTILLPMSLLAFITALRRRAVNWGGLVAAGFFVLTATHFTAGLVFILVATAVGGAQLRLQPWRRKWRWALLGGVVLAVALVVIIGLPLLTLYERVAGLDAAALCRDEVPNALVQFVDLPGVGATYLLTPSAILAYHPAALVALALSVLLIRRWRRFSVRFLLAPLVLAGFVSLSPPIFQLLTRLTQADFLIGNPCYVGNLMIGNLVSNLSAGLVFSINVPIVIAIGLGELLRRRQTLRRRSGWLLPISVTLVLVISATEPFPIPFSLRDQVRTMDDALAHLDTQPAEINLALALSRQLTRDRIWHVLAPNEAGAAIIQRVPNTLLAAESVGSFPQLGARFFGGQPLAPLFDAADYALLQTAQIDLVVLRTWDTRLPQFLLDSERYELLLSESGFLVFRVVDLVERLPEDSWFSRLNDFYQRHFTATWQATGWSAFAGQPVTDPEGEGLAQLGAALPATPLRDYGLVWLAALRGQTTAEDNARWQTLTAAQPALIGQFAWTLPPEQGAPRLLAALDAASADVQLLAARELLTERYIYLLSTDDLHRVLDGIAQSAAAWNSLTRGDFPSLTLMRIDLLMARGLWSTVVEWIDRLPALEIHTDEYAMQALALLAQGDISAALTRLERTLDPDWLWPRQQLHPDRWEDNTALQLYWLLQGNLAERAGQVDTARAAYEQAITAGDVWAARVWLAQLAGDAAALGELDQAWRDSYHGPLPEFVSLLTLTESGQIAVNQTQVSRTDTEQTLRVSTLFGYPYARQFPPQFWHYDVRTAETGDILTQLDVPAAAVHGALLRQTTDLPVAAALPELTQIHLIVQSRHDNRVLWGATITPLVLARPDAAVVPADAHLLDALALYTLRLTHSRVLAMERTVDLTLYWETSQPLSVDYQVSVRVLDAAGVTVWQRDTAPVNGRYPMSQWRVGVPVADPHQLVLPAELPPGRYTVAVVVYPLDTLTPLTFYLPSGEETGLLEVGNFTR